MEKYTGKMIPFDIEKFNAGYEPVYRNGNPVKRVIQTPECNSDSSKLFSIGSDGGWCNHYESGDDVDAGVEWPDIAKALHQGSNQSHDQEHGKARYLRLRFSTQSQLLGSHQRKSYLASTFGCCTS